MKSELLIIFYRNPEIGKVKTRLAATMGDAKALAIYLKLASHTRTLASEVDCDRVVYYSDYIDTEDAWSNTDFSKQLQKGSDLGARMENAFARSFAEGYKHVCIIGTDSHELTTQVIVKAFGSLRNKDAVIGPAVDGGYYLLGMSRFIPELFQEKEWSTKSVCEDTINDFNQLAISYHQLPTLRDVDTEADLPNELR
jgi:rSAM/selenodomain-associated transferase 1